MLHSPEPWTRVHSRDRLRFVLAADNQTIMKAGHFWNERNEANWLRIVACVNVLHGVPGGVLRCDNWGHIIEHSLANKQRIIVPEVAAAIALLKLKNVRP